MSERGVTLFELLVVLVVVGVIAAFALPAYRQQMRRVHRAEAMTALQQLQGAEESHYQRHDTYTARVSEAPPDGLGLPPTTTSNKYAISVALAADGQSFIATATPMPDGGQADDFDCLALSLDARGRRAVSGTADARNCWR
jgi:type IV pilus assembly protein PilE